MRRVTEVTKEIPVSLQVSCSIFSRRLERGEYSPGMSTSKNVPTKIQKHDDVTVKGLG